MGSLALLGSLPRLGLLFNFEVCWAWFWAQVILLDNCPSPLRLGLFFSFISFFLFLPRLGHLSSSSPFFFAAWLGFLLLLLFGLNFVALSLYIKYF
jgi:hypothetical protein